MTSTLEFTYLYDGFSLKIDENALSRAVRVKTAVKDKIKRVFETKKVNVNNTVVESVQTPVKESLIDLESEKLGNINDILNKLEEQKGITHNANRAVLFTQPLVAKITRVSTKWFEGMPRIEKKVENVSSDIPSVNMINHLGGEVVPGNWNNVVEKEEVNTPLSLGHTLEAVPTIEPTAIPVPEVQNVSVEPAVSVPTELEQTSFEPVTQVEMANVNIEIPKVSENTDIYRFPSFDFNMETIAPTVSNEVVNEPEVNNVSFDFVPEPMNLESTTKDEYVSEPVTVAETSHTFEMPSFEENISNNEVNTPEITVSKVANSPMEDKIGDLLTREFIPNPANNFVPENVDNRPVEDKIDEILGRSKVVEMPAAEPETTSVPEQKEEKPVVTQGQIIARLRRVNNEMAEKDATIKSLNAKNEALKEEAASAKDKITDYEVRVSDLTAKNTDLASQNERLASKLEEVETNSRATISKLEAKVEEVSHARVDEIEALRRQVEELKTRHASEIASIKEKHNAEIKSITETKDRQIQAIYSTISEALGEVPMEDDYTRGMAA